MGWIHLLFTYLSVFYSWLPSILHYWSSPYLPFSWSQWQPAVAEDQAHCDAPQHESIMLLTAWCHSSHNCRGKVAKKWAILRSWWKTCTAKRFSWRSTMVFQFNLLLFSVGIFQSKKPKLIEAPYENTVFKKSMLILLRISHWEHSMLQQRVAEETEVSQDA